MNTFDTWALPLLKRRLLAGERVTQADMLRATNGRAWRLSAAIYFLRKQGWEIHTASDGNRIAHYWLPRSEIRRLRAEEEAA